jgi:hypothetical protein
MKSLHFQACVLFSGSKQTHKWTARLAASPFAENVILIVIPRFACLPQAGSE